MSYVSSFRSSPQISRTSKVKEEIKDNQDRNGSKGRIKAGTLKCATLSSIAERFMQKTEAPGEVIPQLLEVPQVQGHEVKSLENRTEVKVHHNLKEIFKKFKTGDHLAFAGPTGSGKTTLLKTIAQNVIDKKYESLQDVDLVIFLKCGDLNTEKRTFASKLLLSNIEPELDDADQQNFEKYANENPHKVLIIFDGIETFPGYFSKKLNQRMRNPSSDGSDTVYNIVYRLFHGTLFPGCRIISSSVQYNELWKSCSAKLFFLVGLTDGSIRIITHQYFESTDADSIMQFLESQPGLLELCRTPMILVFTLIGRKKDPKFSPTLLSDILLSIFDCLIERYKLSEKYVESLKEFSYSLIKDGRVSFSAQDLRNHKLDADLLQDIFIYSPSSKGRTMFFLHQSILEMMASFHVMEMKPKKFESVVNTTKPRYFPVLKMLSGFMLNENVRMKAEKFSGFAKDLSFVEKANILLNNLKQRLQNLSNNSHPLDVLNLIWALHEAGDGADDMIQTSVSEIMLCSLEKFSPLLLSDAWAIGSVISRLKCLKKLTISNCNLSWIHVAVLLHCLSRKGNQTKIGRIDFSGNNLGPSDASHIVQLVKCCQTKELNLLKSSFFVVGDNPEEMFTSLRRALKDYKLKALDVSYCCRNDRESTPINEEDMTSETERRVIEIPYKLSNEFQISKDSQVKIESEIICGFIHGGSWRNASYETVHALGCLLPNVTEELKFHQWKLNRQGKQLLQSKLDDLGSENLKVCIGSHVFNANKNATKDFTPAKETFEKFDKDALEHQEIKQPMIMTDFSEVENLDKCVSHSDVSDSTNACQPQHIQQDVNIANFDEPENTDKCVFHAKGSVNRNDEVPEKLQIAHHPINKEEINKLVEDMSKCPYLDEFALRNCNLDEALLSNLLALLKKLENPPKVKLFSITATTGIDQLLPTVCSIMQLCHVSALNIEESTGSRELLQILYDSVKKYQLEDFCKLDLSYIKNIEDFATLGKLSSGRLMELKMANCDLETKHLKAFSDELHDCKLKYLDISYNVDLDEDDITLLPKILSKDATRLVMRGCELSEDDLDGFNDKGFSEMTIEMMDFSHNKSLECEGVTRVVRMAMKLGTKELSLASCSLDKRCLTEMLDSSDGSHVIEKLDISENCKLSSCPDDLSTLLKRYGVRSLNFSNCKLTSQQIYLFAQSLKEYGVKLSWINVSDSDRTLVDNNYVNAVTRLAQIVDGKMVLLLPKVGEKSKEILRSTQGNIKNISLSEP